MVFEEVFESVVVHIEREWILWLLEQGMALYPINSLYKGREGELGGGFEPGEASPVQVVSQNG